MAADTIPLRLQKRGKTHPDHPAYYAKAAGQWVPTTWRVYADQVRQAGKALIGAGLGKGSTVAILGFNRPEWVILDCACMSIGGAPAGIYTTCSPEEVQYIIHHAESPVVLVESHEQWKKIEQKRAELPLLKHVVLMRGVPKIDDPLVKTWDEFLAMGKDVENARFEERLEQLEPSGLATLIYTSGTTGPPKGVMLSHENLAWTADVAKQLVGGSEDDWALSYLPLSHIAEQMFSIHGSITTGYAIYFAESLEKVPENLKEVQPRVFFGVPRIWEKFHAGITAKAAQTQGAKKKIGAWAKGVSARYHAERMTTGREPGGLLALQMKLARKLVFSKLKPMIGLGEARVCVSGAAPIAREVLEYFMSLDIPIMEVYGQSEGTGPTSFNRADKFKLGTVGPALPGVEVKIEADGEILVRGKNVFLGYFKEPEATAETLKDGWLCSGDLGEFDDQGFLKITGRKKEIIITAGGKNIAPKNIEAALKNHELIGEAVVIGDRRKFLSALIALEPDAAKRFADARGIDPKKVHEHPELNAEVRKAVDEVNRTLARVEQVKKFRILHRPLTVEDGELTPTLKVKRKKVNEHFAAEIEEMYRESAAGEEATA